MWDWVSQNSLGKSAALSLHSGGGMKRLGLFMLALAACDPEFDVETTSVELEAAADDTTHANVVLVASDSTKCSGVLVAPYEVVTSNQCVGANLRVSVPGVGSRQVVSVEARGMETTLFLDRALLHVRPVEYLQVPPGTELNCLFISYDAAGARQTRKASLLNFVLTVAGGLTQRDLGGLFSCGSSDFAMYRGVDAQGRNVSQVGASTRPRAQAQLLSGVHSFVALHTRDDGANVDVGPSNENSPPNGMPRYAGDFNGDGHDDLVRTDLISGNVYLQDGRWGFLKPLRLVGQKSANVQGVGDFNGDGRDDILWRDGSSRLSMWFSGAAESERPVGYDRRNRHAPVDPGWAVKGVADFDGDGRSDIMFHDAGGSVWIWIMVANDRLSDRLLPSPGRDIWKLEGLGFFDTNQKTDILWRHTNGSMVLWLDGNIGSRPPTLSRTQDSSWRLATIAPLSKTSRAHLVWQKIGAQDVRIWKMGGVSGASVISEVTPIVSPLPAPVMFVDGFLRQTFTRTPVLPITRVVPHVVGLDRDPATQQLFDLAFAVGVTLEEDPTCTRIGEVLAQIPVGGATASYGSDVWLTVGTPAPHCP
jgi:prepilin-type processing-associated H-X9-DG protein